MNVWLRMERLSSRTKVRRTWVKQGFVYITGCLLASTLGTNNGTRIGEFRCNYWQNCITLLACTRSDIGCTAVTQLYTG